MVAVEDKLGLTEYIEEKHLIISTYKGRVDNQMSFDHLGAVINFYKKHSVTAAIIDLRELYGSFIKVMDYLGETFYPVALKSGLKAQAFIVTDDLIIKNLTKKLESITIKFNIEAHTFASIEEANIWIDDIC